MAVEAHGVVTEDLVSCSLTQRVEHRKGCVPVRPGMRDVPVWLGRAQGCVLWHPPPFVRSGDDGAGALLPCVGVLQAAGAAGGGDAQGSALQREDVRHLQAYGQLKLEPSQVFFGAVVSVLQNFCADFLHPSLLTL
tara:strand:- start:285 stop:692 length:408 start_codon:yes stop_codon:yes gene_type:complete